MARGSRGAKRHRNRGRPAVTRLSTRHADPLVSGQKRDKNWALRPIASACVVMIVPTPPLFPGFPGVFPGHPAPRGLYRVMFAQVAATGMKIRFTGTTIRSIDYESIGVRWQNVSTENGIPSSSLDAGRTPVPLDETHNSPDDAPGVSARVINARANPGEWGRPRAVRPARASLWRGGGLRFAAPARCGPPGVALGRASAGTPASSPSSVRDGR